MILQPLVFVTKDEHYDENISLREIVRHVFSKVAISIAGICNVLLHILTSIII